MNVKIAVKVYYEEPIPGCEPLKMLVETYETIPLENFITLNYLPVSIRTHNYWWYKSNEPAPKTQQAVELKSSKGTVVGVIYPKLTDLAPLILSYIGYKNGPNFQTAIQELFTGYTIEKKPVKDEYLDHIQKALATGTLNFNKVEEDYTKVGLIAEEDLVFITKEIQINGKTFRYFVATPEAVNAINDQKKHSYTCIFCDGTADHQVYWLEYQATPQKQHGNIEVNLLIEPNGYVLYNFTDEKMAIFKPDDVDNLTKTLAEILPKEKGDNPDCYLLRAGKSSIHSLISFYYPCSKVVEVQMPRHEHTVEGLKELGRELGITRRLNGRKAQIEQTIMETILSLPVFEKQEPLLLIEEKIHYYYAGKEKSLYKLTDNIEWTTARDKEALAMMARTQGGLLYCADNSPNVFPLEETLNTVYRFYDIPDFSSLTTK